MPTKLNPQILTAAILGFEEQKRQIDLQIAELRAMLDGGTQMTPTATPEAPTGKRREFSASAKKRMKEAQQLRWAKIRGESEPPTPAKAEPSKPKRKLSKAGRAAIVAALKERWREKKVAAKPKPVAARKGAPKKAAMRKAVAKKAAPKKMATAAAQTAEVAAQ